MIVLFLHTSVENAIKNRDLFSLQKESLFITSNEELNEAIELANEYDFKEGINYLIEIRSKFINILID